jgi:hypothetical protein
VDPVRPLLSVIQNTKKKSQNCILGAVGASLALTKYKKNGQKFLYRLSRYKKEATFLYRQKNCRAIQKCFL